MEYDFIRQRITQLREQKGIAEYRIKSYAGVWGNKSGLRSDRWGDRAPHLQGFIATTILIQLGGCAPEMQGDASASTCPDSVQWF